MPTKRQRIGRAHQAAGVSPSEMAWLTGKPQPGANKFRQHLAGQRVARGLAGLLEEHADLIPEGRLRSALAQRRVLGPMSD